MVNAKIHFWQPLKRMVQHPQVSRKNFEDVCQAMRPSVQPTSPGSAFLSGFNGEIDWSQDAKSKHNRHHCQRYAKIALGLLDILFPQCGHVKTVVFFPFKIRGYLTTQAYSTLSRNSRFGKL